MNDSQNIKSNTTVQTTISYRLDTWSQYDNPEEGTHQEGDIKISNTRKTFTAFKDKLWPNGIVYYTVDELIENNPQAFYILQEAMMIIMDRTCIKFQRIYPNANGEYSVESWVNIIGNRRGCYSDLGRNPISHALHEILHTLGVYHEHMRPDRDEYIYILWENIREGTQFNFKLLDANTVNYYGLPYDYSSIMHYSMTAFSKDRSLATIVPKIPNVEIGQRLGLSYYDIKKILITYECSLMYYDKNDKLYQEENNGTEFSSSKLINNTTEELRTTTDNTISSNKKVGIFINSTSTSEHESLNKTDNY
ncbi:PREDICTED: zinc metalloproteinase nas-4-like [Polistes dominula]|uniref:Metalloendopeptidase n=1 Tax=Polistes dominula TaxID=743375 RepID=A0ABM1J9X5_POLDO|nr:PREDICTED: zinc metalloproteinase nas-4-like [Polistes dominula]